MGLRWRKSVAVAVVRPYVINVTFEDGTHREIDLEADLWGPVFEPLRDEALFRQAAVDPLGGSVYWPTGADLAPEFLYFGEETSIASERASDLQAVSKGEETLRIARSRG